ncbi:MAG: tRNA (guanosine(46)-N7)-methyltransferase TrmB [Myxococcaceae bacterium]|nr:tRNA (guanosine(46)-N7)-methyltransferase TrmB [Myxococcaceae bacterium]
MSRVPLRPEVAGEAFLALSAPPDWKTVFHGSEGPLELEIGCGAGGFALEYAARHPQVRFVAFEWRKKFAREVAFRRDKRALKNLVVIEGDAKHCVPKLFAKGSLSAVHLQFPDPWWKRAHQKRAILVPDFTPVLFGLLKPGGVFDLRTDVEDRAQAMLHELEAAGFHNPLGPGVFHPYDPDDVPSTRERRYLVTGQPVFRARLTRP